MKKIILLFFLLFLCEKVNAVYFYYDEEFVSEMFITRSDGNITKSGNPYVLKRHDDNQFVYCIEPLELLDQVNNYIEYSYNDPILNIPDEVLEKINLIAYYGYKYQNHDDLKWYGLTQYLIWQEIYPNLDIYFTNERFGNRITKYTNELEEFKYLVNKDIVGLKLNDSYNLITNLETELLENELLNEYEIVNENNDLIATIKDNKLYVKTEKEGNFTFVLKHKNRLVNNMFLYYSNSGQNLFLNGTVVKEYKINVSSKDLSLVLEKKDYLDDLNQDITLKGAIYGIYDFNNNLIVKGETNEAGKIYFKLPLGNYKLKEIEPSYGYSLDLNEYEINLINNLEFSVYENRITKNLIIHKVYNKDSKYYDEEFAKFNIYKDGILINIVTTDSTGRINLNLDYGTYIIEQENGKLGYCLSDDIVITIDDKYEEDELLIVNEQEKEVLGSKMVLERIKNVPNTYQNNNYIYCFILFILLILRKCIF